MLLLPVWLGLVLMLAVGLGLMASALMVSYRDVQHILPVFTQMLLYASPVAYRTEAVPAGLRPVFAANPLTGLLEGFRWSLLGTGELRWGWAAYSAAAAVIALLAGLLTFKRMERRFADVI